MAATSMKSVADMKAEVSAKEEQFEKELATSTRLVELLKEKSEERGAKAHQLEVRQGPEAWPVSPCLATPTPENSAKNKFKCSKIIKNTSRHLFLPPNVNGRRNIAGDKNDPSRPSDAM
eukprot:9495698-Pyramimonas_sp.AAC.1